MIDVTTSDWRPAPKPVSRPLFAIGDVHGASHLLKALQTKLRELCARGRLVYLGDLIDPANRVNDYDCARVLDLVAVGAGAEELEEIVLMGNHDQFLTLALAAARANTQLPYSAGTWIDQGGLRTAEAWKISDETDERKLALAIWDHMTMAQRKVFERMQIYAEHEDYVLVHAGFREDVSLAEQLSRSWDSEFPTDRAVEHDHPLWMRLHDEDIAPAGRVQIVGHSPRRKPFIGANRIGIDTGVKSGGPLTMIEIVGERLRCHQAWPQGMTREAWER